MRGGYKPQLQASQLLSKVGMRNGNEHCSPFPSPAGPKHPCLGRGRALCRLHLSSCSSFLWSWEPGWEQLIFSWGDRNLLIPIRAPSCLTGIPALHPLSTSGMAGTWEQLDATDHLTGNQLQGRKTEEKLGKLKRWGLEGGERHREETQGDAGSPSHAAGAIPAQVLLGKQPYLLAQWGAGPGLGASPGSEDGREQAEQETSPCSPEHVGLRALPAPSRSCGVAGRLGRSQALYK